MQSGFTRAVGRPSRRQVLGATAATAGLLVLPGAHAEACDGGACCEGAQRWSEAGFAAGTAVVIDRVVVLDTSADVASLTIAPTGALVLDPDASVRLTSRGNIVVRGLLRAAPARPDVEHLLVFEGVDERGFQGGGMVPLDSDVGLWVIDDGRLELQGAVRSPWIRVAAAAPAGSRQLTLGAEPTGWRVGDEIVVVPTGAPTDAMAHDRYDTVRISSVSGRTVSLDAPLQFDHPLVRVAPEVRLGAEVLNLTRNVRIEGTEAGRSHVWITSTRRSVLEHFSVRHMGPRQADGGHTASVLGRYGLHLHMNEGASRGTRIVGVVARDLGSHAFVPHLSHGVSFLGCISHNTFDEAYWYDPTEGEGPVVQDLLYDGCVASRVQVDPSFRGYRLAGWTLAAGERLTLRRSVAVGIQGNVDSAGFVWPEGDEGVWTFHDNVGHNNKVNGSFVWQNNPKRHVVDRLVVFHNGASGVSHGAYANGYQYTNVISYANGSSGLSLRALSQGGLVFSACVFDQAGLSDHAVVSLHHTLRGDRPVLLRDCAFRGYERSGIGFIYDGSNGQTLPEQMDVIDCGFSGNEFLFANEAVKGSVVRLQRTGELHVAAGSRSDSGTYLARWNSRYRSLPTPPRRSRARRASPRLLADAGRLPRTALTRCPTAGSQRDSAGGGAQVRSNHSH